MTDRRLPLVTIAIPTFNRANKYLKQAIECSRSQTYKNIEIIVSDNCSTDNTEEVVKSFNDPRIRYFRQTSNVGMLNNENFCVDSASGEFFLLLCDDDMIDEDLVEACLDAANYDTNVGVILTGTRVIDEAGVVLSESRNNGSGLSTKEFFLAWFEGKVPLYLCSTLYNTRELKGIGGFRSKMALYEDVVALVQLASRFGRVDVPEVKAGFRKHGENIGSTAKIREWCEDSLFLLDIMCRMAPEDARVIKERGLAYFCGRNYRRAGVIDSTVKRLVAYFVVYRAFSYYCSPLRYLYRGERARASRFAKNIRNRVAGR
jgi:glycosyltransferase involved in cell wall biosynthesis